MYTLIERFREESSKLKDFRMKSEAEFGVAYPTGFLNFDFMNGTKIHVKPINGKPGFSYNSIGILDGSINMFIGRSSCGKTTAAMQMAANIIRPYEKSGIFHDDIEGGIIDSRAEQLLQMTGEELKRRYIHRNSGISSENLYKRIKMIHDLKLDNRDDLEYDTGLYDSRGERISKLTPTVYIIDSLALLTSEKFIDGDELAGSMSVTASAKVNADTFRKIIPMLKSANIILFVINHVLDAIDINPMAKKKGQLSYLKQGETMPGGKTPVYLSNNIFRFDDVSKMKEGEGLDIHGAVIEVTFLKSRTSSVVGKGIQLLFDFANGFDPTLSLFLFLKDQGIAVAKGAYFTITGSDIKFTQKGLIEKLNTSPEFQNVFMKALYTQLNNLIGDSSAEAVQSLNNNNFNPAFELMSNFEKYAC